METKEIRWQSPSNIALVKYWGKRDVQIPMNPSLSLTLSKSFTNTALTYAKKENTSPELSFEFNFENRRNPAFECKIRNWLEMVSPHFSFLSDYDLIFNSANSFPHSSGIASSASSYSAMALCLCSMEKELTSNITCFESFEKKATYLARLGSGSAARSVFGGFVAWGKSDMIMGSSDEYAIPLDFPVHDVFNDFCDSILVVSSQPKSVSSSNGHLMMLTNPYAELRYKVAELNFNKLVNALKSGNVEGFVNVVENEALNLHAMFLTSSPGYILASPGTFEIIHKIRQFRGKTGLFLCFTLDAGPNVHLLYPKSISSEIHEFIRIELASFCENGIWIDDEIGKGPMEVGSSSL